MKSTDLRIGNWVINHLAEPDDNPQMVYDVLYDSINTMTSEGVPYDMVSPIPLDESILVKCGFEKVPNFTVLNSYTLSVGRNRHLSIGCVGTPNEVMFLVDSDSGGNQSDCIVIHNFDYNGKLYLHTLQNWFYLATGEELTITL